MEYIEDVPAMAFHRTFHAAIKGIQQDGLLVGGGARRNSGRAHIYLARTQIRQNEVVPGNRRLNPLEVVVALREAVADGLICFTTKAGAILSPYNISSAYIVHIRIPRRTSSSGRGPMRQGSFQRRRQPPARECPLLHLRQALQEALMS